MNPAFVKLLNSMFVLLADPSVMVPLPLSTLMVYDSTVCPIWFPYASVAITPRGICDHSMTISGDVRLIFCIGPGRILIVLDLIMQSSFTFGRQTSICTEVLPAFFSSTCSLNVVGSVYGLKTSLTGFWHISLLTTVFFFVILKQLSPMPVMRIFTSPISLSALMEISFVPVFSTLIIVSCISTNALVLYPCSFSFVVPVA